MCHFKGRGIHTPTPTPTRTLKRFKRDRETIPGSGLSDDTLERSKGVVAPLLLEDFTHEKDGYEKDEIFEQLRDLDRKDEKSNIENFINVKLNGKEIEGPKGADGEPPPTPLSAWHPARARQQHAPPRARPARA